VVDTGADVDVEGKRMSFGRGCGCGRSVVTFMTRAGQARV
jgi:hypothetical protein